MPRLEINGHQVDIDERFLSLSPEQQHAEVDHIASQLPQAQPSPPVYQGTEPQAVEAAPSPQADVAKSLGAGVAKGVIGLAGLSGDVGTLMGKGANWLGQKTGLLTPEQAAQNETFQAKHAAPTSGDIQQNVEKVTGSFHEPQTTAGQYAQTVGEFVPAIVGGPGSLIRRAVTQVALPAVASETAGRVTKGTKLEPAARIGAAVLAPGVANLALHTVAPLGVSPGRAAAVETMRREGVDLTAGQKTGSRALRYAESQLSETPGGGSGAQTVAERQKEQFTTAAFKRAGENANRATPEALDRAFIRLGHEFDRLSANNTAIIDPQFAQDANAIAAHYSSLVGPSSQAPIVANTVADILNVAQQNNGVIPGAVYQAMRSRLDRSARSTHNDPQLSHALFDLRNAFDDVMERSLIAAGRTDDLAAWQQARREYRNLLPIERAATAAGEDTALGLLSPAQLRSAVVNQNRRAYGRGQGDLAELTRAGTATMLPMPQSGTAPRLATQTVPAMVGGGIGAMLGGPAGAGLGAGLGTLGAAVAPPLLGRLIMSAPGQAYLSGELPGQALALRLQTPPSSVLNRSVAALLRAKQGGS